MVYASTIFVTESSRQPAPSKAVEKAAITSPRPNLKAPGSCLTESNHRLQFSFALGPRFEGLVQVSKIAADQMVGIIIVVGTKLLPYILLIMDEGHSLAGERMQSD